MGLMVEGLEVTFSLKKWNSHVPACDRTSYIRVLLCMGSCVSQAGGLHMDLLFQYSELGSSRGLT